MTVEHRPSLSESRRGQAHWTPLFLAWLIALLATAGALFLGEVMGKAPCVLCWYQRIAMFPLVAVLGVGLLEPDSRNIRSAWPLAWAGWAMALYHCLIFWRVVSEALSPCGKGASCADADVQVARYAPLHQGSDRAVKILEAARLQGKY
jgi:disulfide bond formation protein DsbB